MTMTETTATSLRAISSNSFSWFSCLSNEGLGVSNVKSGSGVSTIYGEISIPWCHHWNIPMDAIETAHRRRRLRFLFDGPPIHEAHSSPEWLGCSQGPAIWKDSPPNSAASFIAANKMSQKNACVYLALVFLALFVLPYVVCLCVFSTIFFPKGNELQLPCWVAPPWQEHLGMDLNKLPEVVP